MFNQLKNLDLILGSQSPRRKSLLQDAGLHFRIQAIPTLEEFPPNLEPEEIAEFLCRQKAEPFRDQLKEDSILITADTIVVKDNQILNKASDEQDAFRMLSILSGTYHNVITGVCLSTKGHRESFHETTRVYFHPLTDEEIHWYIRNFKPFDKAGAYGIQEWIGMIGVEKIEGCYYNVMGLPVAALFRNLKTLLQNHFS
ncbi:MAG: septum formation protein Maf [Bacteroidetes bacterium]|nr:MAG: septum formation protein Maf [Bacteroidota bacterium]